MSYSDYTNYSLDPIGRSRFFGIYSGIVKDINDPLNSNRIQVSVPQITGDDSLNWAESSIVDSVNLPAVGDKVWVTFESGDTSYPVWMSGTTSTAQVPYGAFSSYVTQTTSSTLSNPVAMAFETTDENYLINIAANDRTPSKKTRITFPVAGTYNIQFSAQFQCTSTQDQDVYIWLRKNWSSAVNGTNYSAGNVTGSTGLVSVPSTHGGVAGHNIVGWNFVLTVAAGDYYEFMWQGPIDSSVTIETYTANSNRPSTASLVLTVTPVRGVVTGGGSGSSGSGSVTSITAASPLTGGTITTTGTIGIDQTALSITNSQVSGLGTASTKDVAVSGDASTTQVVMGNDSRLTNSRTPTSHQSTHQAGGTDEFQLGTVTAGSLTGAQTFTTTTPVTNSIALLNQVLGKLVPAAPTAFPGATSITLSNTVSAKMAYATTDQGGTARARDYDATVIRSTGYTTNTFPALGPGNTGTLSIIKNGTTTASRTLVSGTSDNGSYTSGTDTLWILNSANYPSDTQNFWETFQTYATGTVNSGWNRLQLNHSGASNTSPVDWYCETATIGTPTISSLTFGVTGATSNPSSGIPHFSAVTFTLGATLGNLMRDTYRSDSLMLTTATVSISGVATISGISKTYADLSVTPDKDLVATAISTTAPVTISGFGSSTSKPIITAYNAVNLTQLAYSTVNSQTIYYRASGYTLMNETSITNSLSPTSTGRTLIAAADNTTNTPAVGTPTTYSSSTSLASYPNEAKIVAGVLKWDASDYTGILPTGGPSYTSHSTATTQYFTFQFSVYPLAKFDINITSSGISGCWVKVPGSPMDTSCGGTGVNGWMDMSSAVNGGGQIGTIGTGVTGTNGCAVGGVMATNTPLSGGYTCTFNTVPTTVTYPTVYVRIALQSTQSVTALSIGAAH